MVPEDVAQSGSRVILANTYHLMLRPGHDVVKKLGGLHRFCGWPHTILTDSGGFQVFSLSERRTIDERGVVFQSPYDGASEELTPERAVEVQEALGSDIAMAFDECPAADATKEYVVASME